MQVMKKKPRPKADRENPQPTIPPAQPLKPRRRLFLVLLGIFIAWMCALGVLYFTTRPS
jgi:hypothetical protein